MNAAVRFSNFLFFQGFVFLCLSDCPFLEVSGTGVLFMPTLFSGCVLRVNYLQCLCLMESFMKEYVLQKVRLKDQIIPFDLALQNADSQKQ